MEEIAARASKAMVRGAVEAMADKQAEEFDAPQPCPACGKLREVKRRPRVVAVRGGAAELHEPVAHCSTCRRIFFPQREALRLDGHGYSATIVHRIMHMAAASSSFDLAAVSLNVVGELDISDRQINKLSSELGGQMAALRDRQVQQFVKRPFPREVTAPATPIEVAAVFADGGRMRTREPGRGAGVHNAHWRETKNAALHRMSGKSFDVDPQPELPDCFCNQAYVEKLVHGLKGQNKNNRSEELPPAAAPAPSELASPPTIAETDPRRVVAATITYLENNRQRMDYARYRREGLPFTSSLAESLVKQVSKRVKGTEMFWDDGPSGEAIL